jgi:dihydroxyacetone kinase-like predicted kinase
VVDSGGKGLFFLLEGMLRHVYGESLETPTMSVKSLSAMNFQDAMDEVEEGQDYEVVVDFVPKGELDLISFYGRLEEMGTSIQVGEGEGMYRMHIHVPTEKRYEPIDYIMGIGTVTKVAIENLLAQMDEIQKSSQMDFYGSSFRVSSGAHKKLFYANDVGICILFKGFQERPWNNKLQLSQVKRHICSGSNTTEQPAY